MFTTRTYLDTKKHDRFHVSTVGVPFDSCQAFPGFLITLSFVFVLDVIGGLAVWRHQPQKKIKSAPLVRVLKFLEELEVWPLYKQTNNQESCPGQGRTRENALAMMSFEK